MKPNGSIGQGVNGDTLDLEMNLFPPKDTNLARFPTILDANRKKST